MSAVVQVKDLSKRYYIGKKQSGSLRETLSHAAGNLFSKTESEEFWALKDVSFEVQQGEVLGIIGKNGAGKSTLLKILSRITEPTTGSVVIDGRVSSLLEVGTGFHPELTGRENIFLNGAILGMKRAEIRKKFDEIVAFSGIEQFIDTPVKRYSSGMYVRLAFAVAAHLEPEILIIDEVLAVGDAEFQKKCLGKMKDVSEQQGRTVIFVSHNMSAILNLCARTIFLRNGRLNMDGNSISVINEYLKEGSLTTSERIWKDLATAPGGHGIKLVRAAVHAKGRKPEDVIRASDEVVIDFDFYQAKTGDGIDITINVFEESGVHLCHIGTVCSESSNPLPEGFYHTQAIIPANLLNARTYYIDMWFGLNKQIVACMFERVLTMSIEENANVTVKSQKGIPGVIHPLLNWKTEQLTAWQ